MKKLILIITLIVIIYSSFGQWSFQESNTTQHLWDVAFVNTEKGWAVGNEGTILYTYNGGELWSFQNSNTNKPLYSICFPSENTGYIVGGWGECVFLKSTDGGLTWNNDTIGIGAYIGDCYSINDVFFVNNDTGYIINGLEAYKTTDGGNTWTNLNIPNTIAILWERIYFTDANNGVIVGNYDPDDVSYEPIILKTSNGGASWSNITPIISNFIIKDIHMINENIFYAVGYINELAIGVGRILKTIDGGINWEISNYGGPNQSIFFLDENEGYIVDGGIYHTTNGGLDWEGQVFDTITPGGATAVYFSSVDTGYIVGEIGKIFKTTNGGGSLGIPEISNSLGVLRVFPNPTSGTAHISYECESNDNITLILQDVYGIEIRHTELGQHKTGEYDFNCSDFSSGLYLVILKTESRILTEKLIIK